MTDLKELVARLRGLDEGGAMGPYWEHIPAILRALEELEELKAALAWMKGRTMAVFLSDQLLCTDPVKYARELGWKPETSE